ncbi:MAG: c-type cytochrome [Pseudomonadota bacterium]
MKRAALIFALCAASPAAGDDALVDYVVENGASIPAPLVAVDDGAEAGAAVFAAAGCADCHKTPGDPDAPAIGPDLTDVGARLTAGEIRLMIVDPRIPLPDTEMPGYYAVGVFGEAPDELVGLTRLSAGDVERLVAYLSEFETAD